jgi:hypothetical protein
MIEAVEADAIPRAVLLKGADGGPPIRVEAHADAYKSFPTLTAGSMIRVKGECRGKGSGQPRTNEPVNHFPAEIRVRRETG